MYVLSHLGLLASLTTSRRGWYPSVKPSCALTRPVRYTAGTVSFALLVSLLYVHSTLRNYVPFISLGSTYLNYAYWLCVPRRALTLSHTMRQWHFPSRGPVDRQRLLPGLELGDQQ